MTLMKFTSDDGTPIASHFSGKGPPLVLVHGMAGAAARWSPILPWLVRHFTVYAVDRRGRGSSGDHVNYALEREFEDIARVADAIDHPVNLLGHSLGGLIALEAALQSGNIHKLVLYEPPAPPIDALVPPGIIDRLEQLIGSGDREKALVSFMRDVVGMPPDDISHIRSTPAWPDRVAAAHTIPRELRTTELFTFEAHRYENLNIPVLLLLGGDSPELIKSATRVIDAALPDSRIVEMPGQQHVADQTAPDLFTQHLITFLAG
jgi:pimeloyl-ACP methyl ester carboxylesterase